MQKIIRLFSQQPLTIKVILLLGLLIQIITSNTAVGFFHPDQHFQIIEFSSYQLNLPNATNYIWELQAHIRSTIQVYFFTGFVMLCNTLGITDAFTQTTILRITTGVALWLLYNILALYSSKKIDKKSAFLLLVFINCSWFFPYVRSLFNSEMLSSFVFFGTIFWYSLKFKESSFLQNIGVGFLLALAFYIRFQFAFGIVGFGVFVLLQKQFKAIFPLVIGFLIGVIVNTCLDYLFYHQWVCTPYLYFTANISQGKAAEFGKENFTYYIVVLLGVVTILPLSILVFWHWIKQSFININNVFVLSVLFFIAGHMVVAHKEERFMFPIIQIIPIIIAISFYKLLKAYHHPKKIIQFSFRVLVWLSLALNTLLLVLFMFIPYAQTLHFARKLNYQYKNEKVTCLVRTPLETESLAPYIFYTKNSTIQYEKLLNNDSLFTQKNLPKFIATTFNQAKNDFKKIDSLGYKPVLYSTKMLWKLNELLHAKNGNTINDIWVLYKR